MESRNPNFIRISAKTVAEGVKFYAFPNVYRLITYVKGPDKEVQKCIISLRKKKLVCQLLRENKRILEKERSKLVKEI